MCSNAIQYFSTNSAAGPKRLVLLIVTFTLVVQSQPVTGDEVPNEGFSSSHINVRPEMCDNQRQQNLENYNPGSDNGTTPTEQCSSNKSFLDRNHPLLITIIIGLSLTLFFVVHCHVETKKALFPLKKKVVDLTRNLWKVSTAFENQQDEIDNCNKISLESKVKIESLEGELRLAKQVDDGNQNLIKKYKRMLLNSGKIMVEMEDKEANRICLSCGNFKTHFQLETLAGQNVHLKSTYQRH